MTGLPAVVLAVVADVDVAAWVTGPLTSDDGLIVPPKSLCWRLS
jgi:hypothetical protein